MPNLNELEKRVAQVPLFRACSKRDRCTIARRAALETVIEGEELVREGQRGHELFIIVSGEAVVTRRGRRIATLRPGQYFGELAVVHPGRRTATVTAVTPMEVLVMSSRELTALLSDVPLVARKLLVGMAGRLQHADVASVA